MRRFLLIRKEDATGISGTGMVAEGVQFHDGKCVLAWRTKHRSISVYTSAEDVVAIHGHEGKTIMSWLDEDFVTSHPGDNGNEY